MVERRFAEIPKEQDRRITAAGSETIFDGPVQVGRQVPIERIKMSLSGLRHTPSGRRPKMTTPKTGILQKNTKQPLEDADHGFGEFSEATGCGKSKVECICPGCGKMHVMKIRWIGRGVPRKFCESCRNRETPFDDED